MAKRKQKKELDITEQVQTHVIQIPHPYFRNMLNGRKNFLVSIDKKFKVRDLIVLQERWGFKATLRRIRYILPLNDLPSRWISGEFPKNTVVLGLEDPKVGPLALDDE